MNKLSIVAAAMAFDSTGALAEETTREEPAKAEKKICKTEKMTGSLTRVRRTCLTQREWDRLAELTRKGVEGLERDANQAEGLQNRSFNGPGG